MDGSAFIAARIKTAAHKAARPAPQRRGLNRPVRAGEQRGILQREARRARSTRAVGPESAGHAEGGPLATA